MATLPTTGPLTWSRFARVIEFAAVLFVAAVAGYHEFKPISATPAAPKAHAAVMTAAWAYLHELGPAYQSAAAKAPNYAGLSADAKANAIGQVLYDQVHPKAKLLWDATLSDPDLAGALKATGEVFAGAK